MTDSVNKISIARRFRGLLPVVIDVETGGLNPQKDALLEIAAVIITIDSNGFLKPLKTYFEHVIPFPSANLDPEAMKVNKIDPYHPFRFAIEEKEALNNIFSAIDMSLHAHHCKRGILVGHNAWFDLQFIKAAAIRCGIKSIPLHSFTTLDTATLGALAFGQTVLARACKAAKIEFDRTKAHSAIYDAEKTTELFCHIFNKAYQQFSL